MLSQRRVGLRPATRSVVVTRAVAEPASKAKTDWSPRSWRERTALQQPTWPDQEELEATLKDIRRMPPLVFAGECRQLQERLAACTRGDSFVLFGGDCAESFSGFCTDSVRDTYRVLLQMGLIVMYGGGLPVVKIGRMAGQFAKPRSADTETIDGVTLPSYRGDIINEVEFTEEARTPKPGNMLKAYNQSACTLNLLRAFSTGGYAGLERIIDWNLDFVANSDESKMYKELAIRVEEAMQFIKAVGVDTRNPLMTETEFYTAHEVLLLDYEEALTREDSTTGLYYDCSAHLAWIGERTRQMDGAHIEFFRGINNPIGVKVSNKCEPQDLVSMIAALNPDNVPGRLTIIIRMGADNVRQYLPALIKAVQDAGQVVNWVSDPVHGNTETVNGFKTRRYEKIRAEVEAFFDVHDEMGSIAGGVHLEMTGDDVTECIGGGAKIEDADLASRYHTHCDPRLNAEQALEMAFFIASRLCKRKAARVIAKKPRMAALLNVDANH